MKLLVCFKIIPDFDQMQAGDFIADGQMQVNASFVRTMWNCFDESGLEYGLRLSDEAEGLNLHLEKTALTVSGEQAELYLKTLNALKYDKTVRADDQGQDLRFAPDITGQIIASYAAQFPQDFILMGMQAVPGNQGLTPYYTAQKLRLPVVAGVVDIHVQEEGSLQVVTEEDGALYTEKVKAPAILIIGNAAVSKLRVPTLKDRLKYGKKAAVVTAAPMLPNRNNPHPCCLTCQNRERKGEVLDGERAAEDFWKCFDERCKGRKEL